MTLLEVGALIDKAKAFSVPELTKASGLPRQTVVDVLNRKSSNPSIKTLNAISRAVDELGEAAQSDEPQGVQSDD